MADKNCMTESKLRIHKFCNLKTSPSVYNATMSAKFIFPGRLFFMLVLAAGFVYFTGKVQASEAKGKMPGIFSADPQTLVASKSALAAGDATLRPALNRLLADADKGLERKPSSVMDKIQIPPSGDKHDYISQAPYFWRDTNSPGAKYVNRDGERNPEAEKNSDARNFATVCYDTHTLALAYYFSGDEKYASKAAEFIRVWFLNPATHESKPELWPGNSGRRRRPSGGTHQRARPGGIGGRHRPDRRLKKLDDERPAENDRVGR